MSIRAAARFAGLAAGSAALALAAAVPVAAQDPPAPVDFWADDAARIEWLAREGVKVERRHAIVWAPRDTLDADWVHALADTLDRGVAALREVMGAPYDWQRIGEGPVTFYLAPGRFVAHGTGYGAVFIPVSRVLERLAPFLHEASHELLAPHRPFYYGEFADTAAGRRAVANMPLWLFEGLPDYLAHTAAPAVGIHEGDVFEIGGLERSDSVCAARVRNHERGREVIEYVGSSGRPGALFTTERAQVAPIFYACGQSLARHVVERIGIRAAVGLMPLLTDGAWADAFERAAGEPIESFREAWLRRIGLGGKAVSTPGSAIAAPTPARPTSFAAPSPVPRSPPGAPPAARVTPPPAPPAAPAAPSPRAPARRLPRSRRPARPARR